MQTLPLTLLALGASATPETPDGKPIPFFGALAAMTKRTPVPYSKDLNTSNDSLDQFFNATAALFKDFLKQSEPAATKSGMTKS